MPNCSHTKTASWCESAMFFGASGSIAGGTMFTPPSSPTGTYVATWKSEAAYCRRNGCSRAIVAGLGVEMSMWHRHTQAAAFSGARVAIAAGCGSCTMHTSQSRESSRAFISLYWNHVAHCSSSRSCGLPWRALCISFVALKNSSRP